MAKALADGGSRPTMFQMTPRLTARMDFIASKLALNRSQLARQFFEECLQKQEAVHGVAPESEHRSMLPPSVGPTRLDNDRTFWVTYNGVQEQLKESVIIERYLIPRVPGVVVCLMGSQEWRAPEEWQIKIPSIIPPPAYVPKPDPNSPPPPYVPKPNGMTNVQEAMKIVPPLAPNAPPAFIPGPPAPPVPKVERKFHAYCKDSAGQILVQNKSESEIQLLLDSGEDCPVCLEGDTGWKKASDYGLAPKLKQDGVANGNGVDSRSGTPTLI